MADEALKLEIDGLKELQKKAIQMVSDMHGEEIGNAMRDSTLIMLRRVMKGPPGGKGSGKMAPVKYIPVDTGRLRASMTPVIRMGGPIIKGIVGTNVKYGPYMEFGTKPHWPPPAALERWAHTHKTNAYLVGRAISRRGNRALKFMKASLDETRERIQARFALAVKRIVKKKP